MLTFVIPLRHPASAKNWSNVTARLRETLTSLEACCSQGLCRGVLVANKEALLPDVPKCIDIVRVTMPPPPISVFRGEGNDEERRRAVWLDKGTKIATGALHAREFGATYIMPVDADDLVSKRLPEIVVANPGAPGWYVEKGWLLPVGSKIGLILDDFHNWCGTYVIVRIDLLPLGPTVEEMNPEVIRLWFGHHRELIPLLKAQGHQLLPLPFPAAVYRIGHGEGNFQRCSLTTEVFSLRHLREQPIRYIKRLRKLRPFLRREEAVFLGRGPMH